MARRHVITHARVTGTRRLPRGRGGPIDEYLGGLGEHFASLGLENWHSMATVHPHPIRANWKVAWATHLETYHFAFLHKNTAGPLVYGNTGIADFYGLRVGAVRG